MQKSLWTSQHGTHNVINYFKTDKLNLSSLVNIYNEGSVLSLHFDLAQYLL